jgi:hypothetical protein
MIRSSVLVPCLGLLGCASTATNGDPSKEPSAGALSETTVATDSWARADNVPFTGLPTQCAHGQSDGVCTPPRSFVKWLCGPYPHPDVALILFAKSSPFTRAYVHKAVDSWYTSGQQSTSATLLADEEVIVLSHPQARTTGLIVAQGEIPYDILRIDGVCSSLEVDHLTMKRPSAPRHANIPWQQLDKKVRDALSRDPIVAKAASVRRNECKGTTTLGMISAACVKADDHLSAAIADYIANGGSSPLPATP